MNEDGQGQFAMTAHPPRKKRIVLAVYVDFLFFSAFYFLGNWLIARMDPSAAAAPFWVQIVAFVVVEALLRKFLRWSPGFWALGIHPAPPPAAPRSLSVHANLLQMERWWTMLLGVLMILEGTKVAIRWGMWHPPAPFMGVQLGFESSALVSVITGSLLAVIGLLILRGSRKAALWGIALYAVALVSALLSYDLLSSWGAADAIARREYQGIPPREGEVEMMREWAPRFAVISAVIVSGWLLAAHRRFTRAGTA